MSNINKALKTKNKLAKSISEKKGILTTYNSFLVSNKDKVEYNTANVVQDIEKDITEIVDIKSSIAKANTDVWSMIFRQAELKGLIETLKLVPVKKGTEIDRGSYGSDTKEVEYDSTLSKIDIEKLVKKYEKEIEDIQDKLDKFNFTTEI